MRRSKGIRRESKKRAKELKDEIPIRKAYMERQKRCLAKDAGAPGECFGRLECHEPWSRARGGPTDDERNFRAVCSEHNRRISQDVETMRWAWNNGFLVHSWEGPEWLQAQA